MAKVKKERKKRKDRIKNKIHCGASLLSSYYRLKSCQKSGSKNYKQNLVKALMGSGNNAKNIVTRLMLLNKRRKLAKDRRKNKTYDIDLVGPLRQDGTY